MEFDADTVSAPRLVAMKRGEGGYGFNLHGERNAEAGQTISAVDDGCEAQKAGLRVGDKVVEVNGVNVEKMSHSEVVKRIKMNPNEVSMLVVDQITCAYLKKNDRPITADMANLMTVYQPEEVPKEPEPELQPEELQPTAVVEDSVLEVQESDDAPPPTEPPKEEAATTEAEIANEATTPEEVKQLNEVLDKEDAATEIPASTPVEPQTNGMENHKASPEPTPTPTIAPAPVDSAPASAPVLQPARPTSKPLRSTIKQQKTESWDEKFKKFQQL